MASGVIEDGACAPNHTIVCPPASPGDGEAVLLTFILTQHLRDEPLIRRLADYLGCGRISKNREGIYFVGRRPVTKFKDLK